MPIYEYRCDNCGQTFEILQKFNDDPLTECILCSKGPVKKLISVSSFILKGPGFYVNDYKRKDTDKRKEDLKSSSGEKSTESSKSSGKSDKTTE